MFENGPDLCTLTQAIGWVGLKKKEVVWSRRQIYSFRQTKIKNK